MSENNVVTCVYCGHEYPEGTLAAKQEILTRHIKVCQKHPMREAEQKIEQLKSALIGLIGVSKKEELDSMELLLRSGSGSVSDSDKIAAINAINVLRSIN